jgi:hypothetical protein
MVARSTMGWAFGMSVSILFLALWGRAVVVDTDTLAESLSPLAGSGIVMDFVGDWMADEMVDAGADPAMVEPTIDYYLESSGVGETVEVVHASASPDPEGTTIDMAALVGPSVPELTAGLAGMGFAVTEDRVSGVVEQFDPLVIRQPGSEPVVGPNSPTAARLGTAALLAFIALIGFGLAYVTFSEDRVGAVRSLATRVAVGGLSFAVFLRVGSWVLDPDGGRAPVQETLSALARSQWSVPSWVALFAAMVAGAIYLGRRWLRPAAGSPSPDGRSKPRAERPESLSARR